MGRFAPIDPAYFLYIGVFVGVVVLFEGLRIMLFGDGTETARTKRVKMLRKEMVSEKVISLLRTPQKQSLLSRIPVFGTLPAKMLQAGMTMKPSVFLGLCAAIAGGLFLLGTLVLGPKPALVVAVLTGLVIPMSIINIIRKKRVEKFATQLPDALELMMRGLRVGHPLNVTIMNVAQNMQDPIGTEFRIMANQITYGDELNTAIADLADRIDQEDMHYLAVSIGIQHGTGGNLAKMLGTLARVIRQRFAMRRRIKAISSEGRMSAGILSMLPLVMFGGTSLTAPDYYSSVQDDPLYLPIGIAITALVVGNYVVMRKLVNFRI